MTSKRPRKKPAGTRAAGDEAYRAPSEYEWEGVTLRMPPSPLTPAQSGDDDGIPRLIPEPEYREKALSSRNAFLEFADRVERMDPTLKPYECIWIAGAVRAYASQIYLREPKPGRPPKIDPLAMVMRYIALRRDDGLGKMDAIAKLEEELGVSDTSIKEVLKRYGQQVRELEEAFFIPKGRKPRN